MALIGPVQGYGTLEIGYNRAGRFMSWSSNSDVITVASATTFYGKDVTFTATISATSPNRTLNVNGITSSGGTGAPNSGRIRLFNMQSSYPFIGKIYYMKIYDHDTIVRDLIPCYRVSDRVAGLYDTINDVF